MPSEPTIEQLELVIDHGSDLHRALALTQLAKRNGRVADLRSLLENDDRVDEPEDEHADGPSPTDHDDSASYADPLAW